MPKDGSTLRAAVVEPIISYIVGNVCEIESRCIVSVKCTTEVRPLELNWATWGIIPEVVKIPQCEGHIPRLSISLPELQTGTSVGNNSCTVSPAPKREIL